jgi:hypothetical protein
MTRSLNGLRRPSMACSGDVSAVACVQAAVSSVSDLRAWRPHRIGRGVHRHVLAELAVHRRIAARIDGIRSIHAHHLHAGDGHRTTRLRTDVRSVRPAHTVVVRGLVVRYRVRGLRLRADDRSADCDTFAPGTRRRGWPRRRARCRPRLVHRPRHQSSPFCSDSTEPVSSACLNSIASCWRAFRCRRSDTPRRSSCASRPACSSWKCAGRMQACGRWHSLCSAALLRLVCFCQIPLRLVGSMNRVSLAPHP